jgi:hypothetical protein
MLTDLPLPRVRAGGYSRRDQTWEETMGTSGTLETLGGNGGLDALLRGVLVLFVLEHSIPVTK